MSRQSHTVTFLKEPKTSSNMELGVVAVGVGVISGSWGHKLGPEEGGKRGESQEESKSRPRILRSS